MIILLNYLLNMTNFFSDLLSSLSPETTNNINTDLLGINHTNSFDADWTAAFGNISNQQQQQQQFQTSSTSSNSFLPSSLLNELLTSTNKMNQPTIPSSINSKPKPMPTTKTGKSTDKSNWFNQIGLIYLLNLIQFKILMLLENFLVMNLIAIVNFILQYFIGVILFFSYIS